MRKPHTEEWDDLNLLLWHGHPGQAKSFGLLAPPPPPEGRWTRQQKRAAERRVAKDYFRESRSKGLI